MCSVQISMPVTRLVLHTCGETSRTLGIRKASTRKVNIRKVLGKNGRRRRHLNRSEEPWFWWTHNQTKIRHLMIASFSLNHQFTILALLNQPADRRRSPGNLSALLRPTSIFYSHRWTLFLKLLLIAPVHSSWLLNSTSSSYSELEIPQSVSFDSPPFAILNHIACTCV